MLLLGELPLRGLLDWRKEEEDPQNPCNDRRLNGHLVGSRSSR